MATATLSEMLTDLKAEVGYSLTVAHGVNRDDTLKYILKRVQRELYASYDWPQFALYEKKTFTAGERYIGPFTNIDYERINRVWCSQGNQWTPLTYGITPANYAVADPDADIRSYPITNWKLDPVNNAVEVWPLPSTNGTLMVQGQKNLGALVSDSDSSTLDGTLIVLFAAAEVLARDKAEDAALKLQKAQQFLASIRAQFSGDKHRPFSLVADGGRRPRVGIDYIPSGYGSGG